MVELGGVWDLAADFSDSPDCGLGWMVLHVLSAFLELDLELNSIF